MDCSKAFAAWRQQMAAVGDDLAVAELEAIKEKDAEIQDRFFKELEFGTGGLRGKLGIGTNRINRYTVGKATQGLAAYLHSSGATLAVCIGYDTRHFSKEFALAAALVLCANGVKAYLFPSERPTPMLSFAVRYRGAGAGIVITASHNPKEYNGYKVYGCDGGQITDAAAGKIADCIGRVDAFADVKTMAVQEAVTAGLLCDLGDETDTAYDLKVKELCRRQELIRQNPQALQILYTPLHGAGSLPVPRVLKALGFLGVDIVEEQAVPNGDFPGMPCPNPEEPAVFAKALERASQTAPDIILATDPDCDRVGVLCRTEAGEYRALSGNEMGALLCNYLLQTQKELGLLPPNGAVVKTIVTSDLATAICTQYGVQMLEVLTGFKYIGEKVGQWETSGDHTFLFGFEESYGYLAGDFVRDKDAVIACALIAEMALYYKMQGHTLPLVLDRLQQEHGFHAQKLLSFVMPGQDGCERMAAKMAAIRADYRRLVGQEKLLRMEDYLQDTGLPKSNVLRLVLADGSWVALRPSGTEPKLKIYLSCVAQTKHAAQERLETLEQLCSIL